MDWDYAENDAVRQAAADPKWRLERQIRRGGEKLDRRLLERYLPELDIPEKRRAFLELILWNKVS